MNKRTFSFTNVGSVSMLMIFTILCMAIMAVLSVSSASSDLHSARRLASHQSAYYEACNSAEENLSILHQILSDLLEVSGDTDSYYRNVKEYFSENSSIEQMTLSETSDQKLILTFDCPLNDSQTLSVNLLLTDPTVSGISSLWEIQSWQEINTADWDADNSLHLAP